MTTDTAKEGPSEAQKIWAELDALEAGKPAEGAAAAAVEQETEVTPDPSTAKTEDTSTTEPAAAAAVPAATAETDDRQALLDKINGLEAQVQQLLPLATRVRNVEGRVGGINGELQTLKTARETAAAAGHEAPTATQIREAQGDPGAMAKLKKDYPEFGAAMEAALEQGLSGVTKELADLRAKSTERPAPLQGVTPADMDALRAEMHVEIVHRGWKDTVRKPEFAGWLNGQPREVQMLAASDSPQDAIRLLDLHVEASKAATTRTNTQRLESAAAIPSGRGASKRAKPVEEMSATEYWAYLDQQDAQTAASKG